MRVVGDRGVKKLKKSSQTKKSKKYLYLTGGEREGRGLKKLKKTSQTIKAKKYLDMS